MDSYIEQAINAAIENGTFSLTAVEGIKNLRTENEDLKERLEASSEKSQSLQRSLNAATAHLEKATAELEELKKREAAILNKEIEMVKLVSRAEKAEAVSQAISATMALAFKSPVYTRTISGNTDTNPSGWVNRTETFKEE